jgi:thymidine phosphorylase
VPPGPTAPEVIRTKRDGGELDDAAIRWFLDGVVDGTVRPEQAAALLMAVVWRGLSPRELSTWTAAMADGGERLDLSAVVAAGRPTVDKHSTGGVGDKVSLVLAPLVAACGAAVPQLSGRGLGHTGGTLDKLAAVAGWRAELSLASMVAQLLDVGAVVAGAGPGLAPADRVLYELRDVTATVESVPLIASSIMSKKLAEGTGALVLDVKVGSGAFLPDVAAARELAETMVGLGAAAGVRTAALLTDMEVPLGRSAGNAVEVAEALEVLAGGGPPDTVELTLALAREMLDLAGLPEADPARVLAGGAAMDTWRRMISAQGGDPDAPLPRARVVESVAAPATGYLRRLDARAVGEAAWRLGAGRARRDDPVQAAAGVVWHARPGDRVTAGAPVAELHTDTPERLAGAAAALLAGVEVGDEPPPPRPLVLERIRDRSTAA